MDSKEEGLKAKLNFHFWTNHFKSLLYEISVRIIYLNFQLLGCNMGLLDGIDPNPDNFVTAGILHTQSAQIGYLLRLEPNGQSQVSLVN